MTKSENNVSVQVFEDLDSHINGTWIIGVVNVVLAEVGESCGALSVVITDDEAIAKLNLEYRGLDEPTDVLSFSYTQHGTYYGKDSRKNDFTSELDFILPPGVNPDLGEIVISYPQAKRQADSGDHTVDQELVVLVAHGILHLLGYDHETEDELKTMKAMEARTLNSIASSGML